MNISVTSSAQDNSDRRFGTETSASSKGKGESKKFAPVKNLVNGTRDIIKTALVSQQYNPLIDKSKNSSFT